MEITMKEILKSKGWTLDQMACELNCSISLVSKIKNGNVLITKNMQEKFQEKFPDYKLVNSANNWKEKFKTLEKEHSVLLDKMISMQEELNDYRIIFDKLGKTLSHIGSSCLLNSNNVNDYEILIPNKKRK